MPLYAIEGGRALPITTDWGETGPWGGDAAAEIRDLVIDLAGLRLFPLSWRSDDGGLGEYLVALDATKTAVVVTAREHLDAEALVAGLARSATVRRAPWRDVVGWYAGGEAVLQREWDRFRQTLPSRTESGPGLVMVVGSTSPAVRGALETLDAHVVVVHRAIPQWRDGQRVFDVEPVTRTLVPRRVPGPDGPPIHGVRSGQVSVPLHEFEAEFASVAEQVGPSQQHSNGTAGGRSDMSQNGHHSQPAVPPGAPGESWDAHDGEPTESEPTRRLRRRDFRSAPTPPPVAVPEPVAPAPVSVPEPVPARTAEPIPAAIPPVPQAAPEPLPSRRSRRPVGEARPDPAQALGAIATAIGESELVLDGSLGRIRAVLGQDGVIAVFGERYADPAQAAFAATGRVVDDGWLAWRFGDGGPYLGEALEEVLRAERESGAPRRNRRRAVER